MHVFSTLFLRRSARVLADVVRGAAALFSRVDAAQRVAYAAELGRAPARRDIDRLGLDPARLRAALRA